MSRLVGLAPLSLLSTPPERLVRVAAEAGFDFVGLRVKAVTATERAWDLSPGSAGLGSTLAALRQTGLRVVDTEFLLVDAATTRADWLPALRAAAALGASSLTVAAADPQETRLIDTLAALAEDARGEGGILVTLEPISYQAVRSLPQAERIARAAGLGVLVDGLHVSRFGGSTEQLRSVAPLVPLMQLCDGPAIAPGTLEGLVAESRGGRLAPGEGDFDLAAQLACLTPDTPVSAEVPSPAFVERHGELAWARTLREAAQGVVDAVDLLQRREPERENA